MVSARGVLQVVLGEIDEFATIRRILGGTVSRYPHLRKVIQPALLEPHVSLQGYVGVARTGAARTPNQP